jgi:hypothetical protein
MTRRSRSQPSDDHIQQIFAARLQTLSASPRYYHTATQRFLTFLQADFPRVLQLSELRRDPHLLGWVRSLGQQDPPLSNTSRRIYVLALRRLLRDFASQGYVVPSGLILAEDFPLRPGALAVKKDRPLQPHIRRTPAPRLLPHPVFAEIFDTRIQTLATTLQPQTVQSYRVAARRFLCYVQTDFPHLTCLSELCRDPHLLGWFQRLREQDPPLSTGTRQLYLLKLRRLLYEAGSDGHSVQSRLIVSTDIPALPRPKQDRPSPPPPHVFQQMFEAHSRMLRLQYGLAPPRAIVALSVASFLSCRRISRTCSSSRSCAGILICSPGSATSANKFHLSPPALASNTYSPSVACSRNWLRWVIPCSPD